MVPANPPAAKIATASAALTSDCYQKDFVFWPGNCDSSPATRRTTMRLAPRPAAVLVGACASLAVPGPVSASTPPPNALAIDVAKGTVGGLKLLAPASAYVRRIGIPDYVGPL